MIAEAVHQETTAPAAIVEIARSAHTVTATDGVRIAFDLYQHSGRDTVLIICPGFFQSKNTPTFQRMATTFAQRRDVVCMDFRGHGSSSGQFTFSAKEGADLKAVLAWARARYSHIVLLGFSLGAATAIDAADQGSGIQALIAVSAPTAFEDIEFKFWTPEAIQTGIAGLEPGAGCRPGNPWLKKPRPIDRIRQAKVPILLIHGTEDYTIFAHHSQELFAQAEGPKHMEFIEGGGHAEELYRQNPDGFVTLIEDWLNTVQPR